MTRIAVGCGRTRLHLYPVNRSTLWGFGLPWHFDHQRRGLEDRVRRGRLVHESPGTWSRDVRLAVPIAQGWKPSAERRRSAAASMKTSPALTPAGSRMVITFKAPSVRPVLALTIDDFPSSGTDQPGTGSMALLDLLANLAIPATLFAIGERVQKHPGMAARAVKAGHELGNHMEHDRWSITLGREDFLQQLEATAVAIRNDLAAAGQTSPLRWFRPSGGWFHPPMVEWARSRGYRTVLGSIWPLDGLGIAPPESAQRWIVERFAHPGGIVVLHDTTKDNPATRRTVQAVVPELQQKGYSFVTLSTLLGPG